MGINGGFLRVGGPDRSLRWGAHAGTTLSSAGVARPEGARHEGNPYIHLCASGWVRAAAVVVVGRGLLLSCPGILTSSRRRRSAASPAEPFVARGVSFG